MSVSVPGRAWQRTLALGSTLVLGVTGLVGGTPAAAAQQSAAVYAVVQEGLTEQGGAALAEAFRVENALAGNGAFSYTDAARFGQVPTVAVGSGRDESGQPVVSQALDRAKLDQLTVPADELVLERGRRLVELAGLSADLTAEPVISHAELVLADKDGREEQARALDTSVTYHLSLAGLPAVGQGAKLRLTVGPDGAVTQLSHSLRKLERSGDVEVIDVAEAERGCAALYGPQVRQEPPTLGYHLPELTATGASGKGTIQTIFPQYTCNPVAETGTPAHRLLPAVPDSAPSAKITVTRSGETIAGSATVSGGTGPYTFRWSSSTTTLSASAAGGASVSYRRAPRQAVPGEKVTLEVTDVNGLTSTATVQLPGDGTATAESVPGGGGLAAMAVGPTDVGVSVPLDWQCAQDSGDGYRDVFASKGVPTAFDWRKLASWEIDFKSQHLGGWDDLYVDNVDAAWYTGHGWPGGFTFDTAFTDTSVVPADARWGDRDLEWLQLESCSVLANPGSWVPAFHGLHQMNGFANTAYCVVGGDDFVRYLFPFTFLWWTLRPAFPVRSAWAAMALDKQPNGVKYRSMGLIGPGWVMNINDYFWGQGTGSGPDIANATRIGYWYVTGTV